MTRPLILDVDGTFLKNDLTHEMIFEAVMHNPLRSFGSLIIGVRDKPAMKQEMVGRIGHRLLQGAQPVEPHIVTLAKDAKAEGRAVYLCSGSEEGLVQRLAAQYDFLDDAFGTRPTYNMTSENKAAFLVDRFPDGFDYAGNSTQDFAVWEMAQTAYGVRPPSGTEHIRTAKERPVDVLEPRPDIPTKLLTTLRGFEIWKLVVLLVPLLIISVLIGLSATPMLYLAAAVATLTLALNVERMLARRHLDRLNRGTHFRDNAVASGDLSVPLAVFSYVGLALAGVALLYTVSPWLSVAAIGLQLSRGLYGRFKKV